MSTLPEFSIHHGALAVSDMQRSIDFYETALGFSVDSRVSVPEIQLDIVFLKRNDDYIELFCHQQPAPLPDFCKDNLSDFQVVGTKHIAFQTNDVEAMHRYLQEQEVDDLSDIFDNNPTYHYFFFRDPDGIPLEFISRK